MQIPEKNQRRFMNPPLFNTDKFHHGSYVNNLTKGSGA
jgi:hypothetical protein